MQCTSVSSLKTMTKNLLQVLISTLLIGLFGICNHAMAAVRPNIVFVLMDDMEVAPVNYMNWTKTLVRDQGTEFEHAYFAVPLCAPSRASILTGKYPQNTHVFTNRGHPDFYANSGDVSTIAVWLKRVGYRTSLIGKYMNNYPSPVSNTYIPPGWDNWQVRYAGTPYDGQYNYKMNENGALTSYGSSASEYSTDVYRNKAVAFVNDALARGTPFFLYLGLHAPHSPFVPAPRHAALFPSVQAPRPASFNEADVSDKPSYVRNRPLLTPTQIATLDSSYRNRVRMLQSADEAVKAIIDTLSAAGQYQNTYILFASDNGWIAGPHRFTGTKGAPYEEVLRMPFFLRGPGVPAGLALQHLVGDIDIAPTIAALAGAPIPADVDGRSLASLLAAGRPAPAEWRQSYLALFRTTSSAPGIPAWNGLRTAQHTYVEYPATAELELYDNLADPSQLLNVAKTTRRPFLRWLADQTAALSRCSATTCRTLEDSAVPVKR